MFNSKMNSPERKATEEQSETRKQFIRRREDFVCEQCGAKVKGTGYTNHCPKCLWSKHVDEETPGDRLSQCGGMMEPTVVEVRGDEYTITHRCQKCGKTMRNKADPEDNFNELLRLAAMSHPSFPQLRD